MRQLYIKDWSDSAGLTSFNFPDGQPHVKYGRAAELSPGEGVLIRCRIASSDDLLKLGMLCETLRNKSIGCFVTITYLMGSRMDRRNSKSEPYSLMVIANLLNSMGIGGVSVFVPHSSSTRDLLDNYDETYWEYIEKGFYQRAITAIFDKEFPGKITEDYSIVYPDYGASKRFGDMLKGFQADEVTLVKTREQTTGKITGMKLLDGEVQETCIIVDDLCDGGRTFEEASKLLRILGAKRVHLVVAHGIFSKGVHLQGIDSIHTTDSYKTKEDYMEDSLYSVVGNNFHVHSLFEGN